MAQTATLFWLDDDQWRLIEPILNAEDAAASGPRNANDRITISGIVHVLQTGCAWRDCPTIYGGYLTLVNRYKALKQTQALLKVLAILRVDVAPPRLPSIQFGHVASAPGVPSAEAIPAGAAEPQANAQAAVVSQPDQMPPGVSARDIAATHVKQIVAVYAGQSIDDMVDAIVTWHLEFIERGRIEYWVPGLLGSTDQSVQKAINRFHLHQVQTTIDKLTVEAHEQRIVLLKAIACINYYANQATNNAFARSTLQALSGSSTWQVPGDMPQSASTAQQQ